MRPVVTARAVLMETMMVIGNINNNQIFQERLVGAGVRDRGAISYSICLWWPRIYRKW